MTSAREALKQIQSKASGLAEKAETLKPAQIRKIAIQLADLAGLALKKLPEPKTVTSKPGPKIEIQQLSIFDVIVADEQPSQPVRFAAAEALITEETNQAAPVAQAEAAQVDPVGVAIATVEACEALEAPDVSEVICPAPGMVAHVDREAQTITVTVDHALYQPLEQGSDRGHDAPATLPVAIASNAPTQLRPAPFTPECLFCDGTMQQVAEAAGIGHPATWQCTHTDQHLATLSATHPVMIWFPEGAKSWEQAISTTVPGWARNTDGTLPCCPRCGELLPGGGCSPTAVETQIHCQHCHLATRIVRGEMAGVRCYVQDQAPGAVQSGWQTCFVPQWAQVEKAPAKEVTVPAVAAAAPEPATPPTAKEADPIPANNELTAEEIEAQIQTHETELQLMALKTMTPELEARARELDALIEPLRQTLRVHHMDRLRGVTASPAAQPQPVAEPAPAVVAPVTQPDEPAVIAEPNAARLQADGWRLKVLANKSTEYSWQAPNGWTATIWRLNGQWAVDITPPGSQFPCREDQHVGAFGEFIRAEAAAKSAALEKPALDAHPITGAWIETGACPVCAGDLAVYTHVYPHDGASATWYCLKAGLKHSLAKHVFDPGVYVLKHGNEYKDIPVENLPWLEKYRGNPGDMPVRVRFLCDGCLSHHPEGLRDLTNGKHLCPECENPVKKTRKRKREQVAQAAEDAYGQPQARELAGAVYGGVV